MAAAGAWPTGTRLTRGGAARMVTWSGLAARSARGRLRVGLAPAGNPQFKSDALRSIPLAAFEACFDLPGVDWVIPQPEIRDADRAVLERHAGVISFGAQLEDFADTAALFQALGGGWWHADLTKEKNAK